jgi:uncharacterized protein YdiU (UPF0061 family)
VDYTIFFCRLTDAVAQGRKRKIDFEPLRDIILDRASFDAWSLTIQSSWRKWTKRSRRFDAKSNPRFVLRNHLGETVIRAAQQVTSRLCSRCWPCCKRLMTRTGPRRLGRLPARLGFLD